MALPYPMLVPPAPRPLQVWLFESASMSMHVGGLPLSKVVRDPQSLHCAAIDFFLFQALEVVGEAEALVGG